MHSPTSSLFPLFEEHPPASRESLARLSSVFFLPKNSWEAEFLAARNSPSEAYNIEFETTMTKFDWRGEWKRS